MRSKLFLLFSTRHALLTDLKAQKRGQVSLRAKAPDDDEYDFAEDDDDDPSNFSVGQFVDEDADSFLETKAKTKSITLDEDQHYFNTVRGEDDVQDTYDSANDLKYDDSFVQMALKNHIELNKKNKGMPATFFQERHIQESVAPDDGEFDFAEDDGDDPSNFNVGQFLGDDEDGDGEESFAQIKKPSEENEYTDDSSKVEYVSAQEAKREKGKSKQESPEEDEDDDEDDADEEDDDDEDDEDGDDDDDEEVEDDDDEDEEGEDDDDGDDAFLQNKGVHKRRHHHSHDRSQKHRHHHRQLHHNKHAPLVNNSPSSPREKAAPAKEQTIKLTTEIEKTESTPPAKMLRGTAEKAPAEKPKKRKERTHKKKGSLLGVTDVYEQLAQEEREMKIRGNDDSEWEALDAEDNEDDDEMEESFLQTSDGDDDDYADDRLDGGMEMMGTLENRTENEEDDEN